MKMVVKVTSLGITTSNVKIKKLKIPLVDSTPTRFLKKLLTEFTKRGQIKSLYFGK